MVVILVLVALLIGSNGFWIWQQVESGVGDFYEEHLLIGTRHQSTRLTKPQEERHFETTKDLKGDNGLFIPSGSDLVVVTDKGSEGGNYLMSFVFAINNEVIEKKATSLPKKGRLLSEYPGAE